MSGSGAPGTNVAPTSNANVSHPTVARLALTGESKLQKAIAEFIETLSSQEKDVIQNGPSPERNNILNLTVAIHSNVRSQIEARKHIARIQSVLEAVTRFSPVIDTCIQSDPKLSALVWGAIKLLTMVRIINTERRTDLILSQTTDSPRILFLFFKLDNIVGESWETCLHF